jgi:hypothetical protein
MIHNGTYHVFAILIIIFNIFRIYKEIDELKEKIKLLINQINNLENNLEIPKNKIQESSIKIFNKTFTKYNTDEINLNCDSVIIKTNVILDICNTDILIGFKDDENSFHKLGNIIIPNYNDFLLNSDNNTDLHNFYNDVVKNFHNIKYFNSEF